MDRFYLEPLFTIIHKYCLILAYSRERKFESGKKKQQTQVINASSAGFQQLWFTIYLEDHEQVHYFATIFLFLIKHMLH